MIINEDLNEAFKRIREAVEIFNSLKSKIPKDQTSINILSIVKHNACCGWSLTGEMILNNYLNKELFNLEYNDTDIYFVDLYNNDNKFLYDESKFTILKKVEEKWTDLLKDCFELYDRGYFKVSIPTLITVVEGEMSYLSKSNNISGELVKKFNPKSHIDKGDIVYLNLLSLYEFFNKHLFKSSCFSKNRPQGINRNWVLHGRDDPKLWTEADYFKLINTLSALQFFKLSLNNDFNATQ